MKELPFVVGISGASGAPYARRLLRFLVDEKRSVHLLLTDSARQVIAEETGTRLGNTKAELDKGLREFIGKNYDGYVTHHELKNWNSPLASGSVKTGPMIVIPCSIHTLSAIANSNGGNLLERRADIMLKEKQKLIVVVREMPLHSTHLQHLLKLSRMGVHIFPAMPGFYHHPKSVGDMIDFVVARILDAVDIPNTLVKRWKS